MTDVNSVDLKKIITSVITRTFETMLNMQVTLSEPQEELSWPRIVSLVGVAGASIVGNLCISLDLKGARMIAAEMLGSEEDSVEINEIEDVAGELSNIAGGSIKSRLCDAGMTCQLSIPSVTYGSDFKHEIVGYDRSEKLWFKSSEFIFFVEIFIKAKK